MTLKYDISFFNGVQTPLKSWLFQASVRNCLNCVQNCDDHGLLDFKSEDYYLISNPQFTIWNILYITSHPFLTGCLLYTSDAADE